MTTTLEEKEMEARRIERAQKDPLNAVVSKDLREMGFSIVVDVENFLDFLYVEKGEVSIRIGRRIRKTNKEYEISAYATNGKNYKAYASLFNVVTETITMYNRVMEINDELSKVKESRSLIWNELNDLLVGYTPVHKCSPLEVDVPFKEFTLYVAATNWDIPVIECFSYNPTSPYPFTIVGLGDVTLEQFLRIAAIRRENV
jgi:hypothetical protein